VEKRKNTDTDTNLYETQSGSVRHIVMITFTIYAREINHTLKGL